MITVISCTHSCANPCARTHTGTDSPFLAQSARSLCINLRKETQVTLMEWSCGHAFSLLILKKVFLSPAKTLIEELFSYFQKQVIQSYSLLALLFLHQYGLLLCGSWPINGTHVERNGLGLSVFLPPRRWNWSWYTVVLKLLFLLPFLNAELEYRLLGPLAHHSFGHMLAKPHCNLTFLGSFVPTRMENFLGQYWWLLGSGAQVNLSSSRAVFVPSVPWACYSQSAGHDVCLPGLSALTATNSLTRDWFHMGCITKSIVTCERV